METSGALSAKWLQKYRKSIRFSVKVDGVLRLCKTSKTVGQTTFWSIREVNKIHYKTCSLLRLLGPFSRNGHKKYQNALGFHERLIAFYDFAKHKKPLGNNVLVHSPK